MQGMLKFAEDPIDEIFAVIDTGTEPGGVVGIAIDGVPVYRKGFGVASMEAPLLLTSGTRLRINSTTKHFTCLAYLLLCEGGRAHIDDRIGDHVDGLAAPVASATVRQLMSHTSGLWDAHDIRYQFSGMSREVPTEDLLKVYQGPVGVNWAAEERWCYNNGGYGLITLAIERLSGLSLEEFFLSRLFKPIGMFDTVLHRFDTKFLQNNATPHMTSINGGFERSYLSGASSGNGGIISNADDMLRWLAHMGSPKIGASATWELMFAPAKIANGRSTGYGLGLNVQRYRGIDVIFHAGGKTGCNSQMLKVPSLALDVIIMLNRQDISAIELAWKILDACIPGLDPAPAPNTEFVVQGVFISSKTGRVVELLNNGFQQMARLDGGRKHVLAAVGDCLFQPAGTPEPYQFTLELGPSVTTPEQMVLEEMGNFDILDRAPEITAANAESLDQATYRGLEIECEAVIRNGPGSTILITRGPFGSRSYELVQLGHCVWRAVPVETSMPPGAILRFETDRARFDYSSFQSRDIRFVRA